jgi:hypothetical protein
LLVLTAPLVPITNNMLLTSPQTYNTSGMGLPGLKVIKVSIQEEHGP